MAISRMQEPRQLMNNGGVLTLAEARRMAPPGEDLAYINKDEAALLKSLGGAGEDINGTGIKSYFIKKVFNKAALLYAGTAGLGALAGGAAGTGFTKAMFSPTGIMRNFGTLSRFLPKAGLDRLAFNANRASGGGGFFRNLLGKTGSFIKANPGKSLLLGGGALATALPFFMGGEEEEEVIEEPFTQVPSSIAEIRAQARDFYRNPGASTLAFMPQKKFVQENFYAADGGRAGYANGMMVDDEDEEFIRTRAGITRRMPKTFLQMGGGAGAQQAEQMLMAEYVKYKNRGGTLSFQEFIKAVLEQETQTVGSGMEQPVAMAANGGRMGKQEGGIMETEEAEEMIDLGGQEKDFRETGGFVDLGKEEKADDVPARLSKNEFVFTADAVRNAGGGDIDKGAEIMENLMKNLEAGGEVSEESQGLEGAQAMYDQMRQLETRII